MRVLVVTAALAASCPQGFLREEAPAVVPLSARAERTSPTSARVTLELALTRTSLRARSVVEARFELSARRHVFATGMQQLQIAVPPRTETRLELEVPVRTLEPLEWSDRLPLRVEGQLRVRQGGDDTWLPFEGVLELRVEDAGPAR